MVDQHQQALTYPRKRLPRLLMKGVGRLLLPLLFDIKFTGRQRFPKEGPLIVIGNHTAAMEAVLMNVYTPWQIEMLSSADIPAEKITEWISRWYGVIPLKRGSYDREALRKALSVLDQGGRIGIFPEGGIWARGRMDVQRGVAWLSYRGDAPVLPIGFNDTTGALGKALKFKRPELEMVVGEVIPAVDMNQDQPRKLILRDYANRVMEAVRKLVPEAEMQTRKAIKNESYALELTAQDPNGQEISIPPPLRIRHREELARFLHNPAILKIFRVNLEYQIEPLEHLHRSPRPEQLLEALDPILNYLEGENPYLLTYRFGTTTGLEMQAGLEELQDLLRWARQKNLRIEIIPIWKYYSLKENRTVVKKKQGSFQDWM